MLGRAAIAGCLVALLISAAGAQAAEMEKEPSAELEIGAAGEWSLPGSSGFGPSLALEFTPIEHWLEIETGVSPMFGGNRREWDTELIFKKPFALSGNVEMMLGAGPEWLHKTGGGDVPDSLGAVAVLDFQFWPGSQRSYGYFVEPSYGCDFGRGHEQSLGVTVGLLIGLP